MTDAVRTYHREYQRKHAEKLTAKRRARYASDPEYRALLEARRKDCVSRMTPAQKARRAEKRRAWRLKNRERELAMRRIRKEKNREEIREQDRAYKARNREKIAKQESERRRRNLAESRAKERKWREKYKEQRAWYNKNVLVHNIQWRVGKRLRDRLRALVKNGKGHIRGHMRDLNGCSWLELRAHLARQFAPGMSWENISLWHIDHIKPCARFDLTDLNQQHLCFHYTNLQPLWAPDNLSKGAKYNEVAVA